jgi:DNA polymerase epsilon subunit 1
MGNVDKLTLRLYQVEAYQGDIIMPNRHEDAHGTTYKGHVLAAETYVGGHVEALEAGVFRSDIPTNFKVVPEAIQGVSAKRLRYFFYF